MIAGTLVLEDVSITFVQNPDKVNSIDFTVTDTFTVPNMVESFVAVPQDKFLKALAIAVHSDGMPDADDDYPDAESIMGKIRWIP